MLLRVQDQQLVEDREIHLVEQVQPSVEELLMLHREQVQQSVEEV